MFSRLIALTLGTLLIVSVLIIATTAAGAQQPNLKIGVFIPDPQYPDEQLPSNDDLRDFDSLIGRHTDVFLWYESISEDFYASVFESMAMDGRTIQLAWEPHDFAKDPNNQPEYRLKTITAGYHDNDIRRWARQLRDFGHEVLFRPMCEMNGDWVAWGGNANGNSPQDYIPAWRHVHDIFVQEGATNVKWVWSPNRDGSIADAQATFNTYYPGDAYVDYVGMDGYNWGTMYNTSQWRSSWQMFEEVFGYSYDVAVANTNKPVVICETASTEVGGNYQNGGKAGWIADAFEKLPLRFPRVEMITWFNINKETDWRVVSSLASLQAFRDAVALPDSSPIIDSPSAIPVACGEATVTWNTDEPATSMVEWGTAAGGPYTLVNDTTLNAAHSVSLSGLPDGTIIYYKVSSYDDQANGTTSDESIFTTPGGKPALSLSLSDVYWNSYTDYTAGILSVYYAVINTSRESAYNVQITGSSANNGVMLNSGIPAALGSISGAGGAIVKYNVPTGANWFIANNTASAMDRCGNSYTYP